MENKIHSPFEKRVGSKPGSVLLRGQLSIWDVCYQTPLAALFEAELVKDQP
jgi:hypothetical protein